MWQSAKELAVALGKGWIALVVSGLSAALGLWQQLVNSGVVEPLSEGGVTIPPSVWFLVSYVGLAGGVFWAFHQMRVERDNPPNKPVDVELETEEGDLTGIQRIRTSGPANVSASNNIEDDG